MIEQIRRLIYGEQPQDDASITEGLVNQYLDQGIGVAAKQNYKDNFQLEGIGFINNSFYSTFKGIAITEDEKSLYTATLPQLPLGIGTNEGISRVVFKDGNRKVSYPAVLLSETQVAIQRQMRTIPNKILCYSEGLDLKIVTSIIMTPYTVSVTLVSGGDSTNLDSNLNVPADYIPAAVEYIKAQLLFERKMVPDMANDGRDN